MTCGSADRVGALDALQVLVGQDLAVAQVALRAQIEVHIGELRRITSRYKRWRDVCYENAWCLDVMRATELM